MGEQQPQGPLVEVLLYASLAKVMRAMEEGGPLVVSDYAFRPGEEGWQPVSQDEQNIIGAEGELRFFDPYKIPPPETVVPAARFADAEVRYGAMVVHLPPKRLRKLLSYVGRRVLIDVGWQS